MNDKRYMQEVCDSKRIYERVYVANQPFLSVNHSGLIVKNCSVSLWKSKLTYSNYIRYATDTEIYRKWLLNYDKF